MEPAYLESERDGRLAALENELWNILQNCRLCPRNCRVNRFQGERGVCSSTGRLKVASFGPHFGEERPLVGSGGSGTIFFSNCNLLCCFCQNREIAHEGEGSFVTHDDLAGMMAARKNEGPFSEWALHPRVLQASDKGIMSTVRVWVKYCSGSIWQQRISSMLPTNRT